MKNLLNTIGNTPTIRLTRMHGFKDVNLYAKLEGQNPSGSIKDRVALYMITEAEKRGELTKNKTILEATSGNMGIALAMVGAQKGYDVSIVMSEAMSDERKTMLRAYGAKLILTDGKEGTQRAIAKAKKLAKTFPNRYWFANQFNNPDNVLSHYHGLALELLDDIDHIDYLIAGGGTTGTLMGIARRFKEDSPNTKVIGVFPQPGYGIQGLQNPEGDFAGKIYESGLLDGLIYVPDNDAFAMARQAARTEGLFVGMSSGAALFAAKQFAQTKKSADIVVIIPDRGEKYLSTDLFV